MHDSEEEKLVPLRQELVENEVQPVRTAEIKLLAEDPELIRDQNAPPLPEPHKQPAHLSTLSLFSGMEMVTKGRPLCERQTSHSDKTDSSLIENQAVYNSERSMKASMCSIEASENSPSTYSPIASEGSKPVSAFSFLNF